MSKQDCPQTEDESHGPLDGIPEADTVRIRAAARDASDRAYDGTIAAGVAAYRATHSATDLRTSSTVATLVRETGDDFVSPAAEQIARDHGVDTRSVPARLDTDRTARPLTRIVHHPPYGGCIGPYMPLVAPEYEDEYGKRIPLTDATQAELIRATPETVLRAMLKAYNEAAVDAWRAWSRALDAQHKAGTVALVEPCHVARRAAIAADRRVDTVRFWLALCLEGSPPLGLSGDPIGRDFEDRLSGAKPIDAAPPEKP